MGIYDCVTSDVIVCLKQGVWDKLAPDSKTALEGLMNAPKSSVHIRPGVGRLYMIQWVEWFFECDDDLIKLYKDLEENHWSDDYLILVACDGYPDALPEDIGEIGCWENNPWGTYKRKGVEVGFDPNSNEALQGRLHSIVEAGLIYAYQTGQEGGRYRIAKHLEQLMSAIERETCG